MRLYRAQILPLSAFGTPLKGDTLFGHFCWMVRNRHGEDLLTSLLDGYTAGRPFAVFSDAMPSNHLPRPILPSSLFDVPANSDRKAVKRRVWLPVEHFQRPVKTWPLYARSSSDLPGAVPEEYPQFHNTLNRETGTTGKEQFTPYAMTQLWYGRRRSQTAGMVNDEQALLDIYIIIDDDRLSANELNMLLIMLGEIGFGRDASIGLGKFGVKSFEPYDLPSQDGANAWLTLAFCAPQGLAWNEAGCFYQPFTRFGRHGDAGVLSGRPFKTPVLMADAGAVLTPLNFDKRMFVGQGLGNDGSLSKAIHQTVHQGYAPVVGIKVLVD